MDTLGDLYKEVCEWEGKYRPIFNHLRENASWNGTMFETYGEDVHFVYTQPHENVWTWVDGDDGTYLIAGRRRVNRIGYFITEVPWETGEEWLQVSLEEEETE